MIFKARMHALLQHTNYKKSRRSLPFFFTFANAILGFFSIIQAVEKNYLASVYCLILAACMDLIDGRIARKLNITSPLGAELDSLADAISFCLAPCILLYAWYPGTIGYSGMIALGIYLSAGIFRLAKFNITSEQQSSHFIGLPTPIAALFVVSLIWYNHWILNHAVRFIFYKRMPFILITALALLMVSSIPFPSFKKSKKMPLQVFCFASVIGIWLFSTIFLARNLPLLFIAISLYIIASVARWFISAES